ncbi:uncharacterized protein LOC130591176 [Beta vulgaris subsp. vulgaris]|uniref:uncharacterized protein LOC130591176 n=1 Tax=Beta vulgaris subsp. vulgaris TaxID=3555 RepID=UPI002546DA2E|nr:uncharacterized protein LOC130591176 [Beta vulgaris subsp. vulgaris]
MLQVLAPYPDFLIIGDINQLDHYGDKLGGATLIRGWEEFTNWKHTLQLQDVPFVGSRFTWTNNRDGVDLIMERLDRVYVSPTWNDRYPLGYTKNFPILHSDHAAIFYQTEPPTKVTHRSYQFENWCLIHPELPNMISSVWRIPIAGSTMYRFTKHLSIFRTQIRQWCLDHKVVWGIHWKELSTKLAATATQISSLPQGNDFMLQRQQDLDTSALAHSYWSQRSKDKIVQLGDLPTKFFYNKMRQKQRSAHIYLLRTADNQWTEDGPSQGPTVSDQGQDEAIDLVLRELNLPHLSLSQQQQLLRPFSKAEVHEAMLGIGQGKSPGLDGSTAEFFKLHWGSLGNEVFQAVNHFFSTGFILHEWNQTLLVLLPKGQNPEEVTESFHSHCGLRQGDPLSPYLFLLSMDIFSRMIIMATDIRLFDGIRAHSLRKSFVKFSPNVSEHMGHEYKRILQLDAKESLGTYLGTPVDIQGKKTQHFTFLLDNISQRITAWNHSPISQAGKLILINSVLIASIAHILSVFLIPTTIANKLDAMLARFFWSNSSGKGIAWKSKELLHLQKGAGGLGLRSIAMHNRSLLMKKVWRIQKNSGDLISKVFSDRNLDWINDTKTAFSAGSMFLGCARFNSSRADTLDKFLLENWFQFPSPCWKGALGSGADSPLSG